MRTVVILLASAIGVATLPAMRAASVAATAVTVTTSAGPASSNALATNKDAALFVRPVGYSVLMPIAEPLPPPLVIEPIPVFAPVSGATSNQTTSAARRRVVTLEPEKKASSGAGGAAGGTAPSGASGGAASGSAGKSSGPPALLPVPRGSGTSDSTSRRQALGW